MQLALRTRSGAQLAEPRLTTDQVAAAYPAGTPVDAVVDQIRDDLGRAWLRLPDGVQATVAATDIGQAGVLRVGSVLDVGMSVSGRVRSVSERNGAPQAVVDLKTLLTPSLWQQLEDAGIRNGAVIEGKAPEPPRSASS